MAAGRIVREMGAACLPVGRDGGNGAVDDDGAAGADREDGGGGGGVTTDPPAPPPAPRGRQRGEEEEEWYRTLCAGSVGGRRLFSTLCYTLCARASLLQLDIAAEPLRAVELTSQMEPSRGSLLRGLLPRRGSPLASSPSLGRRRDSAAVPADTESGLPSVLELAPLQRHSTCWLVRSHLLRRMSAPQQRGP